MVHLAPLHIRQASCERIGRGEIPFFVSALRFLRNRFSSTVDCHRLIWCRSRKSLTGVRRRLGWEGNPFGGPIENFDEVRARTRNEKRIEDAKRLANSAEIDKIRREANADAANIEAQHKNPVFLATPSSTKQPCEKYNLEDNYLRRLGLQIFLDRADESEVGRQQFTSDEKDQSRKVKRLKRGYK